MAISRADTIDGLVKGLAVLESFDTERQRLNATQASMRAGLTRAAARRHLLTLAHLGYLETDGSHYWLSPKVLRFSGAYLASARLPRVIQPTLNRLAEETQDDYSAVVLDGDEVVIIARGTGAGPAAGSRLLAYGMHLGARLPAHATSTGRVLLSSLPESELAAWLSGRSLPRLTPHTVTSVHTFKTLLADTAKNDYCVASEEHELGVHAMAVPLRDTRGSTVAALNVIVPPEKLQQPQLDAALRKLWDAARELRQML